MSPYFLQIPPNKCCIHSRTDQNVSEFCLGSSFFFHPQQPHCGTGGRNQRPISCLSAVLAFYISQLSFGILNSLEAVIFPKFIGSPLLYLLLLGAKIFFFALCACCYRMVCKLLGWAEGSQTPGIGLLLFPVLFFFAAENTCSAEPLPPAGTGLSNIKAVVEKYHGGAAD